MPIFRGAGGAGDATNDATVTAVQAAATSAATSATNAANSATAAANSATGAATSATNASNSATTAAGQATTAAGHATNASTFATNSSLSADDSADSATEAEGYASEAFNYKVAASLSEGNASDSADAAQASQLAAETAALAVDGVLTDPDFITVLGLSDELQTVAANSANITAVAANNTNITAVATNETNIDLVAANISDIGIVAEKEADIDTVAGIAANVTTVAGISANVTTVAGISGNVTTVATNNANVTTVATNIASVNTNATNIANINQNAANIVAIQGASANATAAAASATSAAGSATSASAAAAAASAVALGNEPVRHSVRPSLLLDFANTKTLDPRITFTRASTGTYYDGKTVAKAEENLITDSEAFNNWQTTNSSVTANSTTSPDGTSTADSVTENTATGEHRVLRASLAVANATTYVFSVFAKQNSGTRNIAVYQLTSSNGWVAYVDLSTGSLVSSVAIGSGVGSASVSSVGNGWYRVSVVFTTTATSLTVSAGLSNGTTGSYTGDGTSSIFVWGAQLEQRSSVTAYTATTTAPITNYIPALQTAAAGVARFEHNPVTGESLGLEIEEQRTNLFNYSEQFDNAYWTKVTSSITANAVVAPDGTLTADKVVPNSGVSGALTRAITPSVSTSYTFSVYAKAGENSLISLSAGGTALTGAGGSGADRENRFNLALGTIEVSNSSPTITPVGNGWYRLTIMLTTDSDGGSLIAVIGTVSTGNGFAGIYIWGAQLEAGAFATSYIPTVASQVTRSSDAASMTGTNFSSWYRTDEGTVYCESFVPVNVDSSVGNYYLAMSDGTTLNTILLTELNATVSQVVVGGAVQFNQLVGTEPTTFAKMSLAYKANDFIACVNATLSSQDISGTVPVVDRLIIGNRGDSNSATINNGSIKKIAYYAKKLTNAELQGLTTV